MARPARVSPARILTAAAAEFAARGYAGARVDRIARRARVNKAMLYYHFGSKEGLYRALIRGVFTQLAARLHAAADATAAPADQLDAVIAELAVFIREHAFFPAIMLREVAEGGTRLDRTTLDSMAAIPRAVARVIADGMTVGDFRPVNPIAAYFSLLAPLVFYLASAPIRTRLATQLRLEGAVLSPEAFVMHVQESMRCALAPGARP
jgi:TetR/AcrR family transcriptional regulator